jgi:hypothetical protein
MMDLKDLVIEEVEATFDYMLDDATDAVNIADEILDIYHMLSTMRYMGDKSEAEYVQFAFSCYHHSVSSMRGYAFVENLKRQYKAFRGTFYLKLQ